MPDGVCLLYDLLGLNLGHNCLSELPGAIGELQLLQALNLGHNHLMRL
eukprot:COSAG01_NODE_45511_length_408_cov_18.407767_2_plen_47_part_01